LASSLTSFAFALAFDLLLYIKVMKVKKESTKLIYSSRKITTLLSGLLLLTACAGLPVRGTVDGQTIDTRVDSDVARYYLTNYLAGKHSDAALDERIDRVYQSANGSLPDRNELKRLSDEFSVDFAALYFADQVGRVPVNARFRTAFDQAYDYVRKAFPEGRVKLPDAAAEYEFLFVPSYLYKRVLAAGADLAAPRAALQKVGFTCHFVETSEDGAIEANVPLVMAAIRARAESGRRLIIVSASKSGPEVALALTRLGPDQTRHVAAWVNTVGALRGSPVVDERLLPELEVVMGKVDPAGMESLTTARSRQRFESLRVPNHVFVVNYFGIPVSGSISFRGRFGYFPLRKFGPNDGLMLLPDMIFPRGVTLAELGSDHFLLDGHLDITAVALAITLIRWIENPDGETSQAPPK
jgi:hypothetical protein